MPIRQARIEDAERVCELAASLVVSHGTPDGVSGFVDYSVPSFRDMQKRISNNPFFCVDESEGSIVGFLAAYSDSFMQQIHFGEKDIAWHILTKPAHFIYCDALGVAQAFQNRGKGHHLASNVLGKGISAGYNTFFAAAAHKPKRNTRSIRLIEHLEFACEEEFITPNGLAFGIYKRTLT